jgi:hypothetical protein
MKTTKFYLDTEFIESPGKMQLISIGICTERGDTFYAESSVFNPEDANDWVKENVISKLKFYGSKLVSAGSAKVSSADGVYKREVFGGTDPEFWAYFADYDWVNFCWIFGTMMELPEWYPKFCLDLKQEMYTNGLSSQWKKKVCPDPEGEHNALVDAEWNRTLHQKIIALQKTP